MTTLAYADEQLSTATQSQRWVDICRQDQLIEDTGVAALLENGKQVAIFQLALKAQQIYAVSNFDPIGQANVLYRGIVGCVNSEPVVASPLFKQPFSLIDGRCVTDESISISVYPTRINDGKVQLLISD
ncbi:nitrite reductase small subunit NirD [Thalassotalea litorea]|uniref:Nitrite reductase small subunit NirD n=1 Tax=Thalassotalea litorea TaxID=2020715 RepID=A0A5R9IFH3_9GAMM|nr:nitrite reductase small subunit NirD [Thalassotalea litorea]TLU64270.1 nitrite reductase small subunit NirD [Thalassotalea litorea]